MLLVIKVEKQIYEKMINDCKKNIELLSMAEKEFAKAYSKAIDKVAKLDFSEEQKLTVLSEMYKLSILGMEILPDPRVEQRKKIYTVEQLFENATEQKLSDDIDRLKKLNALLLECINNHIEKFNHENVVF